MKASKGFGQSFIIPCEAAAILGSLRRAMKPTARLILVEFVIPEGAAFHFGKWTDLQLLVTLI
jgi:hypothetical protein